MKRLLSIIAAAALLCQAVIVFAQDSGEPSEQSVLEAARAKYWGESKSKDQVDEASSTQDQTASDSPEPPLRRERESEVPYTPVLLSFVPGISVPFGYYDVSLAGGAIASVTRDVKGAEGSGVFNISRDILGFQAGGVFNISRNVRGFQGAGVFNMAEDVHGFQSAGVFNMAKDVFGFQGAGVFNIADNVYTPFQGAGVFNHAGTVQGFQWAGVFNIADSVSGGQVAGVVNVAGHVRGLQIGIVNIADDIDGVQLGLVNIAGNGVDSLGLIYEPLANFTYVHWQAGTQALYTVAGLGAPAGDWLQNFSGFVASFGLGSRSRLLGLELDLDVSAEAPIGGLPYGSFDWSEDWSAWEGWGMLKAYPSVRLTAGLPLGRHLRIVGGLKADIDIDSLGDRVPDSLKTGPSWMGELFGEGFTVWPKFFFGVKI